MSWKRRCNRNRGQSQREILILTVGFESKGRIHDPREAVGLWKLKYTGKQILSYRLQEECSPANPFWVSDLQNCERISICCFKTLNLW